MQHNDPHRKLRNILLVLNTAIHCDEGIINPRCPPEQRAVADTCPPDATDRIDPMAS